MSDDYAVELEEAIGRLAVRESPDGPVVHTFIQGGPVLVGADWHIDKVREHMERHGVAEAGELASGMRHGLVVLDPSGPTFFETVDPRAGGALARAHDDGA